MPKNSINNLAIGVFDSGIGGLTVVKEIIRLLPQENIIYLGDTARVPYGTKSKETVVKYAQSNVTFLLSQGVKFLVIACNTASAHALELLTKTAPCPVIGVIKPGVRQALRTTYTKKIGVIATPSTIKSESYQKEIAARSGGEKIEVFSRACPLFVPLAEEGWHVGPIAEMIATEYLGDFKNTGIDTLILGCTHYPLLKPTIKKVMGDKVVMIDSAEETAKELKQILECKNLFKKNDYPSKRRFFFTDNSDTFKNTATRFLGDEIDNFYQIDITS